MRTALIAGLVTGALTLWLSLPCALSNIDFIYMCASAALVDRFTLPVTSYFPPGYPLLLWALVHAGIDALTSGMLLAAIGAALSVGSLTYLARRFGLPPVLALLTGLLGATLPDVFQVSFNPHVDSLYTGLAMLLIAAAFRLMDKKPSRVAAVLYILAAVVLVTLRYHSVLVVLPVTIAVLLNRQAFTRRAAIVALVFIAGALGWVFWGQYATYGGLQSATLKQVATGKVYRDVGDPAAQVIFLEYDKWLEQAPKADSSTVLEAVGDVWPEFISRKAVVLGFILLALALVFYRSVPPGSILLAAFILLYTLAVSPTYFTPRASALPELLALALAATSLGTLYRPPGELKGKVIPKIDPALSGTLLLVLLLGAIGFNLWREVKLAKQWRNKREAVAAVDRAALELAGGQRENIVGAMDYTGWIFNAPYNLPGPSYTRYWLDDPDVAPRIDPFITRVTLGELEAETLPGSVVVLWHVPARLFEGECADRLSADPQWSLADSPVDNVQIWQRQWPVDNSQPDE